MSSTTEGGAPNGGDGNNDGTPDAVQNDVTSLPAAVGGGYVTVDATTDNPQDNLTLADVSVIDPTSLPTTAPGGVTFPGGLVNFTVEGVTPGATVDVKVYFQGGGNPDAYFKYLNGTWIDFSAHAAIAAGSATLTLTDGGPSADTGDADGTQNGRIVDPGGLAIAPAPDVTVAEGNKGKTDVDVTARVATRTDPKQKVDVDWCTVADTATAGVDFEQKCGHLEIGKNETSQSFKVKVLGDLLDEPNEDFLVQLTPTGGTLTLMQVRVRITDDDQALVTHVSTPEGSRGTHTVAISVIPASRANPNQPISVHACTADGTATAPSDYVAKCTDFAIGKRATSHVLNVKVKGDRTVEPNEDLFMNLTATGGTLAATHYKITITNDD